MTKEELQKIPFHFVCSAAWEDEHTLTYESEDGRLGYCDHTPRRKDGQFGRTRRHWHIEGKVYKTEEKFLEALADFNPRVVGIRDKPYQNTVARMKHERDSRPKATTVEMHPKASE